MTTIAEDIQAMILRREVLRVELQDIESQLLDVGAILSLTINNQTFKTRRGRTVRGTSCRARILALLSDGGEWAGRDICDRLPYPPKSTVSQLSRMAADGDLTRVRWGVYRQADQTATGSGVA